MSAGCLACLLSISIIFVFVGVQSFMQFVFVVIPWLEVNSVKHNHGKHWTFILKLKDCSKRDELLNISKREELLNISKGEELSNISERDKHLQDSLEVIWQNKLLSFA